MRLLLGIVALALALAGCTSSRRDVPVPSSPVPATSSSTATTTPLSTTPSVPPSTDGWPAYHLDARRTGAYRHMPAPTGALHVTALRLDAAEYASPIISGGITVVATENDTVYGLDATSHQLWRAHLGEPARRSDLPCGNIDPSGITGTPVTDGSTVYVVAEHGAPVRHELVALALRTGAVRWRVSVDLPGADPAAMQERGALAIGAGRVWVPFGGRFGDCGDYKGRVIGVRLDGSGAPLAYTVPTPREGGIWAPPGVVVDGMGRLLVAVGNGENGSGDAYDYSDSVLAIDPATARLVDSFSPATWQADNDNDRDLGSQGPTLVGTRWVFQAGKSGTAYVLRQGHLGGIGGEVSHADVCRSFGGTAVSGDVVYVPCTDGVRAVRIDGSGVLHVLWHADGISGSPVLGGGRVWTLDTDAGTLHALDPATGRSTAEANVGDVTRFATPALHGRQVFVPTAAGLAIVST